MCCHLNIEKTELLKRNPNAVLNMWKIWKIETCSFVLEDEPNIHLLFQHGLLKIQRFGIIKAYRSYVDLPEKEKDTNEIHHGIHVFVNKEESGYYIINRFRSFFFSGFCRSLLLIC